MESKKGKYIEWLNADVMHEASREWISELRFIKREQSFLEDLIKSYTLQLIDSKRFLESKKIIDDLDVFKKNNKIFIEILKKHENKLQIMVDGIDQPKKESLYKEEHRKLTIKINSFFNNYRKLKTALFTLIIDIKKKQKHLLKQ